jgi:hypothetical protein
MSMRDEDAISALGLTEAEAATLDPDVLRRAYLHAIKRHKPEVDPEGFQRVRAAFDHLKAEAQLFQRPPLLVEPAPAAPVPAAPPDLLAPFRERIESLTHGSHERVEAAREALAHFPSSAEARALLLDELPEWSHAQYVALATEGVEKGDADCLRRLLEFAPEKVPEAALERLEREGDAHQRLQMAEGLVLRGQALRALALLESVLQEAARDDTLAESALRVVLRFHCRAEREHASRAFKALRAWLDSHQPGVPKHTAAVLSLASDLEAVPLLPAALQKEVARSALAWNRDGLVAAAAVESRYHGFWARRRWRRQVERNAPSLANLLGFARFSWLRALLDVLFSGWSIMLMATLVIRPLVCSYVDTRDDEARGSRTYQVNNPAGEQLNALWTELERACEGRRDGQFCLTAGVLFHRAFSQPYCRPLLDAMTDLRQLIGKVAYGDAELARRILERFAPVCPP